jgi:hypothetical protein
MRATTWSGSSTNQVGPGAIDYVVLSMAAVKIHRRRSPYYRDRLTLKSRARSSTWSNRSLARLGMALQGILTSYLDAEGRFKLF